MWPGPTALAVHVNTCSPALDQSLKRMGLEYVDIFYSHRVDENTPMEETASALAHAVQSGKGAVCRDLLLTRQSGRKNGRVAARVENSAFNSSTFVQFTEPLGG